MVIYDCVMKPLYKRKGQRASAWGTRTLPCASMLAPRPLGTEIPLSGATCVSFNLAIGLYLFTFFCNKLVIYLVSERVFLSSVSHCIKLMEPNKGLWEPLICSKFVQYKRQPRLVLRVLSWSGSSEPQVCSWLAGSTGNTVGSCWHLKQTEVLWG